MPHMHAMEYYSAIKKEITSFAATWAKAFDCVDHNKLKEMGLPNHLTCLLRNLYAGQEATVRTGHGIMDWFQIGKGVHSKLTRQELEVV